MLPLSYVLSVRVVCLVVLLFEMMNRYGCGLRV